MMTEVKVRNHCYLLDDAATGDGHCLLRGQRYGAAWAVDKSKRCVKVEQLGKS